MLEQLAAAKTTDRQLSLRLRRAELCRLWMIPVVEELGDAPALATSMEDLAGAAAAAAGENENEDPDADVVLVSHSAAAGGSQEWEVVLGVDDVTIEDMVADSKIVKFLVESRVSRNDDFARNGAWREKLVVSW